MRLDAYLRRQAGKARPLARKLRRHAGGRDLHDLRVLTRRLRAVVWVSRHSRSGPGLKKLRRELRGLGHALGELRAFEVAAQDARRYGLGASRLAPWKATGERGLRRQLKRLSRGTLEGLLTEAGSRLSRVKSSSLSPAAAELIARLEKLEKARPRSPSDWHRVRIELKKIRYASEALGLGAKQLKRVQDALGRAQDLQVLRDRLGPCRAALRDELRSRALARRLLPSALKESKRKLMDWREKGS